MLKIDFLQKREERLTEIMYYVAFACLIIPWGYVVEETGDYSFLPKMVSNLLLAAVGLLVAFARPIEWKKLALVAAAGILMGIHYFKNGYLEPHYLYQVVYLELAALIYFSSPEVKKRILKYSPYLFYIFLIKAYFFRNGLFVHGGTFSSNLYSAMLMYFCWVEVSQKRYWNLLIALPVIVIGGSKAVYMGITIFLVSSFIIAKWNSGFIRKLQSFGLQWFLATAFLVTLAITLVMQSTAYYQDWLSGIEPHRKAITERNMILYGFGLTQQDEETKSQLMEEKRRALKDARPMSEVDTSLGLRLNQYDYMYSNLPKYFLVGNAAGSSWQMFGHNPHSAVIDFISRLGGLFFLLCMFFYRRLFASMKNLAFNLSLLPILVFQPYGFTIGHVLPLMVLLYALGSCPKEQKKVA
ncbi:hypothetical protein [Bdellovibrio sp. HCB337]|uniref:hypothetical protein n=1 Tax=Bdellovibrio sp. HCB337 TaxID=3394358 RepID=UPI0039A44EF5